MAPSPRTGGTVNADELGRREFNRNRKGWDPVEVRAHLLLMADEIKRLQSAEAGLRSELSALRTDSAEPEEFDESKLTRLLGEETTRVLEAARLASVEIRAKGEESAARLVREAQEQATKLTRDSEELRAAAARESDELVAAARVAADEMLAESRELVESRRAESEAEATAVRDRAAKAADEVRQSAEAEAERLRSGAQAAKAEADEYAVKIRRDADDQAAAVRAAAEALASDLRLEAGSATERIRSDAVESARQRAEEAERSAEIEVETAREQGRAMVQEAREARERMLRDLAERRKVARQQLEALRAGRERLLDAFRSVRSAFDDATDELVEALPAARTAADDAARAVDDDIDAVVAELDASIAAATEEPEPVNPFALTEGSADKTSTTETSATDEPSEFEPRDASIDATVATIESASETSAGAGQPPESFHPAEGSESDSAGSRLRLVPGGGEDLVEDDLDDDDDLDDAAGGDETEASVEAIFARIRADQTTDEPEGGPDGPDAVIISLESERIEVAMPSDTSLELVENISSDEVVVQPNLLDRRDEAITSIERAVSRKLKRVLSDQENSVLHTVRGKRKARSSDEFFGVAADRAAALAEAAVSELAAAVAAGAVFLDDSEHGKKVDAVEVAARLSGRVDEWLGEPLRQQLERVFAESDVVGERADLADGVRATYREWKGDKLAELCGDLVTLAFNRGILASATAGATHCWLVDHGGLPCVDAEDNHLAGAVVRDGEFPTGDLQPPAHPGCRCLLGPPPG